MIVLYEHPLSPYVQKVKIALREKGIPFELRRAGGRGAGAEIADFLDGNPRAEVPFLLHEGPRLFDSTIQLDYLEEAFPDPPLMPPDPAARAQARSIEEVMDTHYEAVNWGLGELRYFRRAEGRDAADLKAAARRQIAGFHAWLEARLAPGAEWFCGPFGRADLSVVPFLNASASFGFPPPEGSALIAWLARANARPAVAQTVAEARAAVAEMANVHKALEAGRFRRQYRDHRLEWMIKSGGLQVVLDGIGRDTIRFTPDMD